MNIVTADCASKGRTKTAKEKMLEVAAKGKAETNEIEWGKSIPSRRNSRCKGPWGAQHRRRHVRENE